MTGLTPATSNAETIVLKSSLLQAKTPLTLAAEYKIVWARSDISPPSLGSSDHMLTLFQDGIVDRFVCRHVTFLSVPHPAQREKDKMQKGREGEEEEGEGEDPPETATNPPIFVLLILLPIVPLPATSMTKSTPLPPFNFLASWSQVSIAE